MSDPKRIIEMDTPTGRLVRRIGPAPALSDPEKARIERALLQPKPRRPRTWPRAAVVAGFMLVGAVASATTQSLWRAETPPPIPPPLSAHVATGATVEPSTFEPMRLRDGSLTIEALHGPVTIEAPDGLIQVGDFGEAAVHVRQNTTVRVEAVAGQVRFIASETKMVIELEEGQIWAPTLGETSKEAEGSKSEKQTPRAVFQAAPKADKEKAKKGDEKFLKADAKPETKLGKAGSRVELAPEGADRDDERILLDRAKRLFESKDHEGALEVLDAYVTAYGHDGRLRFEGLALDIDVLLALDRPGGALEQAEAIEIDAEKHPNLIVQRAELRGRAGRHKDAAADFELALGVKNKKRLTRPFEERAWYGLGLALIQTGKVTRARGAFRVYLQKFPSGRFHEKARKLATPRGPAQGGYLVDPMPAVD